MKYVAFDDVLKLVRLAEMLGEHARINTADLERLPTIEVDEDVVTRVNIAREWPFTGYAKYVGINGPIHWLARWHKLTPGNTYKFYDGLFVDDEGHRSTIQLYKGTLPCVGFEVIDHVEEEKG